MRLRNAAPALALRSVAPARKAIGAPVRASVGFDGVEAVVCAPAELVLALAETVVDSLAEGDAVLVLTEAVGVLAVGVVELTDGEGEGVGVTHGEGSRIGSTCVPAVSGATVILAVQESAEDCALAPVNPVSAAVLEMVVPAPFSFTRPSTCSVV